MNNQDVTIVIADDHPLLLKGLRDFLLEKNFNLQKSAKTGTQALDYIKSAQPMLAILDIEMPGMDGIDVARACRTNSPGTRIILLSYHQGADYLLRAKEANVSGFIIKEDATRELEACIELVLRGQKYFSQKLSRVDTTETDINMRSLQSLTPSQFKIVKLLAQGMTTKEIADHLFLSVRTIEKHRSNIVSKVGLPGQPFQLTQWVMNIKHLLK